MIWWTGNGIFVLYVIVPLALTGAFLEGALRAFLVTVISIGGGLLLIAYERSAIGRVDRHSFMYLPMIVWAVIFIVGGLLSVVSNVVTAVT